MIRVALLCALGALALWNHWRGREESAWARIDASLARTREALSVARRA